jgi:beta-glucosidase
MKPMPPEYFSPQIDIEAKVEELLKQLTIKEKFLLCRGRDLWNTRSVKRLGIPSLSVTDGPHGVAPHSSSRKRNTYFPTGITMASTWNADLASEFGVALGEETRACGKHVILGPGMNIQRSPLCGRTFEYFSEDPFLAKTMAVAIVKGVQSRRVAACTKHFAGNNQETKRNTASMEISERALQEIYLPAFRGCIEEANVWTVMSCYNKVNGVYGSESKDLLTTRLRDQWGFTGFVMSDWFAATRTTSAGACVNAGLSLEMPGSFLPGSFANKLTIKHLKADLKKGLFTEAELDENVRRFLRVLFYTGCFPEAGPVPEGSRNTKEHTAIAKRIAEDGMVLLKNEKGLLPIDIDSGAVKTVSVIGPNARRKQKNNIIQNGGSSEVVPPYEISNLEGIAERCKGKATIVSDPAKADVVIFIGGLNHNPGNDSEGYDRKRYELSAKQEALIKDAVTKNPRTVVVLCGGPVGMESWIDSVPAVLESWYSGLEGGNALAAIMFGDVNPSGKLPITFPKKIGDSPAHASPPRTWGGINLKVYYDEGVFVGYRHYDTRHVEPRFPFGHGLSYTTFEYANLAIEPATFSGDGPITVTLDVTNTGSRAGAETVQLYLQDVESSVERPAKELKGFAKVFLAPGETKNILLELEKEDLSFYDEAAGAWAAEPGSFVVHVGASSADIRLHGEFEYTG